MKNSWEKTLKLEQAIYPSYWIEIYYKQKNEKTLKQGNLKSKEILNQRVELAHF